LFLWLFLNSYLWVWSSAALLICPGFFAVHLKLYHYFYLILQDYFPGNSHPHHRFHPQSIDIFLLIFWQLMLCIFLYFYARYVFSNLEMQQVPEKNAAVN
jgi:hypothetical protein